MKSLTLVLLGYVLTFSTPLLGFTWDEVMSSGDQRATGVWRLSERERLALAQWVRLYSQGATHHPSSETSQAAEETEAKTEEPRRARFVGDPDLRPHAF